MTTIGNFTSPVIHKPVGYSSGQVRPASQPQAPLFGLTKDSLPEAAKFNPETDTVLVRSKGWRALMAFNLVKTLHPAQVLTTETGLKVQTANDIFRLDLSGSYSYREIKTVKVDGGLLSSTLSIYTRKNPDTPEHVIRYVPHKEAKKLAEVANRIAEALENHNISIVQV